MAIEMQGTVGSADRSATEEYAPARTYAEGWAPAVLTDRGAAMCRLSAFIDAFEALSVEDRAWFAYPISELLVTACEAETALR